MIASEFLRNITEIVMAIIGIALIALLLNRNSNTTAVVQTSANALDNLLRTVTLQNSSMGGAYR